MFVVSNADPVSANTRGFGTTFNVDDMSYSTSRLLYEGCSEFRAKDESRRKDNYQDTSVRSFFCAPLLLLPLLCCVSEITHPSCRMR
jgi:hypothetical protein